MNIFRDEQDYFNFLKRMKIVLGQADSATKATLAGPMQGLPLLKLQALPTDSFSLISYCLMPNHFHFLIRQNTEIPLSKLMLKVSTSYSMYFNKKYDHVGGVFQDCFKAVLAESNEQLLWLSAYIHQNPKVAGLVKGLKNWQWSNYLDYIDARKGDMCDIDVILGQFKNISEYADFVDSSFSLIKERKDLEELFLDE